MIPLSKTSPHYTDAALAFTSRTNITGLVQDEDIPELGRSSTSNMHSYPPTPPAVKINPPSPSAVHAKLEEIPKSQRPKLAIPMTQVTQFFLAPHSVQPTSDSLFARALSVLKNHRPSHSNSFTLSRITANPKNTPLSPPPPYVGSPSAPIEVSSPAISVLLPPPVLVFHDRTPVLTVRSHTGLIEINRAEEQLLGVETSFWIAVALTYLEFLEEREVRCLQVQVARALLKPYISQSYLAVLSD